MRTQEKNYIHQLFILIQSVVGRWLSANATVAIVKEVCDLEVEVEDWLSIKKTTQQQLRSVE